jgi:hypothetical protein
LIALDLVVSDPSDWNVDWVQDSFGLVVPVGRLRERRADPELPSATAPSSP